MKPDKIISHACAVLLIVSSIALAFLQVLDIKDVAHGTLIYVAQAFLLAASIFGIDYYYQKFIFKLNDKLKNSKGDKEQQSA